ncbi:MAG: tryptophan--tRNA ligase, partial [Saprospiraceae bacterium]|nr:tryptophan--tRNA ligase [Saprospiraceae bacterium]
YINLFGEPERLRKQIKSAVTDTGVASDTMSAGVQNLFTLLKACGKMDVHNEHLAAYEAGNIRYGDLKNAVADAVIALVEPFLARLASLESRRNDVEEQIRASSANIRKVAQQTLREVKELTGILSV